MKDRLLGRVIADRYRLESRLGVGGMGAVYRARHLLIDRVVAIKILQPERRGEEHFRAWFLREARAANRVNHANIVDINDFGETEDGLAYLVMELLVGEGLSNIILRGPMDMAISADILEQVTAALARAHDLGVVHRDVKPDNIYLINRGGRRNFVKLLDFGLARLSRDGRLAAKGAVFGTPEYMSPEQARGEDASPLSDLYSLGIIFFEMATGRLPFHARDRDEFIESHKSVDPPSPDKYVKDLDPRATRIIMTLLQKDQTMRYRDAHHLLEELKALQRRVGPTSPWDDSSRDRPTSVSAFTGTAIDEVARWALKASIFGRMVARAYPNGGSPKEVADSLESIWRLAAATTRLDGELQAEAKRNEGLERRGRDFRAQVGRRIEDLSREQSRLKREIAAAQEDLQRLGEDYRRAGEELAKARKTIASVDKGRDEMTAQLRHAYELAGAAAARRQSRAEAVAKVEAKIRKWREECDRIDNQLAEFRQQLDRQSSSVEDDLSSGRLRLASKVQERERYSASLLESADLLTDHFRDRPECSTLIDELKDLEKARIQAPTPKSV
ncbi:MAG: protein kinase [Deltaproteobacteria bacterium]|nr:protein kinase [Deltaproteobacteria bacterium]